MNKKLLRKIQRAILREPHRYNQDDWCVWDVDEIAIDGSCGTVGCIAGWACAIEVGLSEYNQKYIVSERQDKIEYDAIHHLDIKRGYDEESGRLFYANEWPRLLKFFFVDSDDNLKGNAFVRAFAGILRIEIFIWSNGKV